MEEETNIIILKDEVIPAQVNHPKLTHEDMIAALKEGKSYEGFLGGVEITKAKSEAVYETIEDEEGNESEVKFIDKFPSYESLDGTKVCIRICKPASLNSWYVSTSAIFDKFVEAFGSDEFIAFKSKSDFEGLISGTNYKEPVIEEI